MRVPAIIAIVVAALWLSAACAVAGPFDSPGATTDAPNVPGDATSWAEVELVFTQGSTPTGDVVSPPDAGGGDIVYGLPFDDSPELGTWLLLACTGALGGLIRRRRKT